MLKADQFRTLCNRVRAPLPVISARKLFGVVKGSERVEFRHGEISKTKQ